MNHFNKVLSSLLLALVLYSCSTRQKADLIFINGNIQTVNENLMVTEAVAISDGKILDTGTTDFILATYKTDQQIDLGGKFVYPGFIDPHSHFMGYSMGLLHANLWLSKSMDEIVERLKI